MLVKRFFALGAAIVVLAGVGTTMAASASAATSSSVHHTRPAASTTVTRTTNWSGNYQGVAYGWTNDHAWAIASYATVATLGSGAVASLACGVLGGGYGPVCSFVVQTAVSSLTAGSARLTNHGIWIAVYPHWSWAPTPHPTVSWSGGRY